MNTSPEIPPLIHPPRTISYELTRWDVFANWMTVIFRNRILQVFVPLAFLFNAWQWLSPRLGTSSITQFVFATMLFLIVFVGSLGGVMAVAGLAHAFIPKHRGVVGQHTLEITNDGLIERTDANVSLYRWPSICRITSLFGYLYIYISDMNYHPVPKRYFSPEEIASFETDLRTRTGH